MSLLVDSRITIASCKDDLLTNMFGKMDILSTNLIWVIILKLYKVSYLQISRQVVSGQSKLELTKKSFVTMLSKVEVNDE